MVVISGCSGFAAPRALRMLAGSPKRPTDMRKPPGDRITSPCHSLFVHLLPGNSHRYYPIGSHYFDVSVDMSTWKEVDHAPSVGIGLKVTPKSLRWQDQYVTITAEHSLARSPAIQLRHGNTTSA
jgi:hypothetical protein